MPRRWLLFFAVFISGVVRIHAQQPTIRVDQLLYSGRPDPIVDMTTDAEIAILRSFLQGLPTASPPQWPGLGPRGFQLQNLNVPNFPQEVRVFQGTIRTFESGGFQYFQDTKGLESYLAQFFPAAPIAATPIPSVGILAGLPVSGSEPPYNPAPWNDHNGVQNNNNCYNYATNKMTGTFAQPGKAAGKMYTAFTCASVTAAAIADGLLPWVANVPCPRGCYKVALVIDPGVDFHWYRQDSNGDWSHKPGSTEATNLDNSNNPITDPRTADRDGYTNFCGFFCVPGDPAKVNIASLMPGRKTVRH